MLRFLLDEGGDLRELQIVEAVFRQLCQLTETSIKIVSDQLSIVDITLLYPVSLELTLLALDWSKLHITRPLILILTAVFLPFEDFSIICRHFQTVSSKENMVYHFKPVEKFMEIFENVWISWMTLLISMNHKGALNMESFIKLQRLLPLTGMYFSGPTTSMSPTHVQPPVTTFVHGLLFHLHKHELDNVSVGMITQVAATLIFVSLFTWSEVLSRTFVVADLFCHHAKVQVPLANMRAILEFGRWFSGVYMEIITNG
ncbi:hypothetical protein DVH24_014768 [Malus domestica]|uniref:Uncharacterized protein n=1 Tax=Malus domestica TaxID=3750 RepID=A0A498JZT1_MALDO|nr:hypothetical protein DVH24_014768 [Malus domestica]